MVARYLHIDPYLYHYRNYGGRECEAGAPAAVRRWRRISLYAYCVGFFVPYTLRALPVFFDFWTNPQWIVRQLSTCSWVVPSACILALLRAEVRLLTRKRKWLARGEMYCAKCEYRVDMLPEDSKFCPECGFPRSASERCWSRYQWPLWPESMHRPNWDDPATRAGSPIISDGANETLWVGRRRRRDDPNIPAVARRWRQAFAWFVLCTMPTCILLAPGIARSGTSSGILWLGGCFGSWGTVLAAVVWVETMLVLRKRKWISRGEMYCAECGDRLDPLDASVRDCPTCGYSRAASEVSWREYRFPLCAVLTRAIPNSADGSSSARSDRRAKSGIKGLWPGSNPTTPASVWSWRFACSAAIFLTHTLWMLGIALLPSTVSRTSLTVLLYVTWLGLLIALVQAEVRLLMRKRRWMAAGEMYCCECGYRIDPLPEDSENCPECGFSRALSERSWSHYRYPLFSAWRLAC